MRISRTLLGIAMIALVTAGCGGSGSDDGDSRPADSAPPKSGKELPVAITSAEPGLLTVKTLLDALPPEPADDAAITERALWTMRKRTVAMAGIPGKTSAACEGGKVVEEPGVTTRCTVTYDGVKVPWSVRFDEPAGDLRPCEITNAGQAVLTAKSVYGEFWNDYNQVSKHLRCGKVPDLELVRPRHRSPLPVRRVRRRQGPLGQGAGARGRARCHLRQRQLAGVLLRLSA
ncbi:hypothetical protein [Streptomyces sp. NPDC005181]|uniref:hypothetical protein n=1 Tax=Streptomyces sp. NPDC005181 TaxID=3156869 RepID=UPI0033A5B0A7